MNDNSTNHDLKKNFRSQFTLRDAGIGFLLLCLILSLTIQLELLGFCGGFYAAGIIYGWCYSKGNIFAGSIASLLMLSAIIEGCRLILPPFEGVMNFPIFSACIATAICFVNSPFINREIGFSWQVQTVAVAKMMLMNAFIAFPFIFLLTGAGSA